MTALTIVDFLLARLGEDEETAREADQRIFPTTWREDFYGIRNEKIAAHVDRHKPARVLADCQAKGDLVGYAAFMLKAWEDKHSNRATAYPDMTRRERHTARLILEELALAYADHPDYREEWRP
jgi:hypothetical protein